MQRRHPFGPSDPSQIREVAMDESQTVADARLRRQSSPPSNRILIGVERQDGAVGGAGFENRSGVPAAAERAVEVACFGMRIECRDRFGEEDGAVVGSVEPWLTILGSANRLREDVGSRHSNGNYKRVARRCAISAPSFSISADWASHRAGLQISIDVLTPTT